MKKIGILGGTFNPIHNGHLILAQNALEQYALDEILFIPSGCSYMKKDVLDAKARYQMTKIAISSNPSFQISPIEINRSGNSYTCDTLLELKKQNPEVQYEYIIGADTLFSMETWNRPALIFESCGILCSIRNGFPMSKMLEKQKELSQKYHANIQFLQEKAFDISSSEIRRRICSGQCVSYFLPESVLSYIKQHHLYETAEE